MKILMLVDFYPPIIGGTEIHVRNLSLELVSRGYNVSVVSLWHEGTHATEVDQGVKLFRIHGAFQKFPKLFSDTQRRFAPPIPDPGVTWSLLRIIQNEQPDLIHGHSWLWNSFIPLKKWSKIKLVITLHDYSLLCPKKNLMFQDLPCSGPGLNKCLGCCADHYGFSKGISIVLAKRAWDKLVQSEVDMILPVSRSVAIGNGLINSHHLFHIMPNFVLDDPFNSHKGINAYVNQLPSENYLLYVGALCKHKGIEVLLQAYSEIINAPPLVLIGSIWPDSPSNFPENVLVFRNWPHEAVMEAWTRSLLGVVPSIWPEPCPTVVFEAMASGRPVIASRIGGLPDLVNENNTGLLVQPGNSIELRNAIIRLLSDTGSREMMGIVSKEEVKNYQARTIVPKIERVYRNLMD